MAEILGYEQEELLGKHVLRSMDGDQQELAREAGKRRLSGVSELREMRLTRQDGSPVWVLVESSPLLDAEGEFSGSVAMVADITDRKRAEAQLSLLATLVESSTDAFVACSLDGAVQSWNPAAENLFGWSPREMIGHALS